MMPVYVLTLLLFLLQLGDWYSTRTILLRGGRELNPIARWAIEAFGLDPFLGFKSVGVTWLGYWLGAQYLPLLAGLVLLYGWVCWHNWRSL